MRTTQNIKPLVLEFKDKLKTLYGDNMLQMILFGSYARGTMHEESDIDLLLILDKTESPYVENKFMNEMVYDFSLEHDLYFSVLATSQQRYNQMQEPLYQTIKNEGIII